MDDLKEMVVKKEFLRDETKKVLDKAPIMLEPWDSLE